MSRQPSEKYLQAEIKELRRRLDEAEAMLQTERRMFHAMAETLTDIVFSALPDGSCDFVNGRIYEITGLAVGTALGSGWSNALHPDDLQRILCDLREAVTSGTPFESNVRLRTTQGTYRRFVMQAHPLRDDAGRIGHWIGTATDVHDFLTTEDAVQQANRQNREFLLKLVHDLRNGIAPIAYAAAILKLPAADDAQKQGAAATIDAQVRELRAFLDRVPGIAADRQECSVRPEDPTDSRLLDQAPRRILLVASDDAFTQEWAMLLRLFGHEVTAVRDVHQALQLAVTFQPEVVAVGFPLPAADGHDWAQRLRRQPALEKALIVAIHKDDGTQSCPDTNLAGCDAVLRTPVTLQDFLKLIAGHETAAPRRS